MSKIFLQETVVGVVAGEYRVNHEETRYKMQGMYGPVIVAVAVHRTRQKSMGSRHSDGLSEYPNHACGSLELVIG